MDIILIITCFFLFARIVFLIFFQKVRKLKYLSEEAIVLQSGEYDFVLFGVTKLSGLNSQNYQLINLETGDIIPSSPIKPQTTGLFGFQKYLRIIRFNIEITGSYRIGIRGLESLSIFTSQLQLLNIFTTSKRNIQFTGIMKQPSYKSLIIHIILLVIIIFIAIAR